MRVKEAFRDHKNRRHAWSLRDVQVHSRERLARLLLILAVGYILFVGLGHWRQ